MPDFDHRALLAELSADERKALLAQSDGPGLLRLAWHWGSIVIGAAYILAGLPGWQLVLVLQGVLIIFLFTTMHETIHRTAFSSDWLNNGVAAVCGFLNMQPDINPGPPF